jgi:hypothetical protein
MKFTHKLPTKEGYYWWTNFGEHTPTIVEVRRDYSSMKLWATNEEFSFVVEKAKFKKDKDMMVDGHYFGEEMWCYIPTPTLNGKRVAPDSY